ncbi:MAG: cation transporter [Anaerovoracaceae bacterium]|jgi:cation transport ATPase
MKKRFRIQDVDCADCAAKMEDRIKKIDGVNDCRMNFLTQKLVLDADDDRFDEIVEKAEKEMVKVDHGACIIR